MERIRPHLHTIIAAGLAALVLAAPPLAGQEQTAPREVIAVYLAQDCGTGDPQPARWLRRVVELGDRAVPILAEAARRGPGPELRQELEADAAEDFERMRALVEEGGLEAVEQQEVVRLARELDQPTYVAMRLRSFELPYRERAVNALAAIDLPEARAALEELAAEPGLDEELATRAREALREGGRGNR